MAPTSSRSVRKADILLESSSYITKLKKFVASKNRPVSLAIELRQHVDELAALHVSAASNFRELDAQGTTLWNLSSKLKEDDSESSQLACLVRVFGCLLLDCAQRSTLGSVQNSIRVLKSTLKTTKFCLDQGHLELAEAIAEKAAYYNQILRDTSDHGSEKNKDHQCDLSGEYLQLRVALAWKQNRLDLAETWLSKLSSNSYKTPSCQPESLADLLFEIGKDHTAKANHVEAVRWLERAQDVLASQPLEDLSNDGRELRIAILHLLTRGLMRLPGTDAKKKAWDTIADLDTRDSDRLAVLILKLDLFTTDPSVPTEDLCDILLRIVRIVHVTESTFKTILHYVHNLKTRSSHLTHVILEAFLLQRLLSAERVEWAEKALVTAVWNLTTTADLGDHIRTLEQLFDTLRNQDRVSIGPSATHAAQMLLWKCIEATYHKGDYVTAETWCRLALHEVFDRSSELNISKIQRKLILCLLATSDYANAREVHLAMSESSRLAPESLYIVFKIAIRSGDDDLASDCLNKIFQTPSKDATLLYACVLEAQHSCKRIQAVTVMQRVLDTNNYGSIHGVHLPALMRCTARLLMQEIEDTKSRSSFAIDAICKLFEGAASRAKVSRRSPNSQAFSVHELDWFSRNAYNLALSSCPDWPSNQILCLLGSCLQFIDQYPPDMDPVSVADQSLRRMFCDFLAGSLLIIQARQELHLEKQLQHYLDARKHTKSFRLHLQNQDQLEGGARDDLLRKAKTLSVYDFEAAIRLKAWHDVDQLLEVHTQEWTRVYSDTKIYGILADITLSSEAPTEYMINIIQEIVNASWQLEEADMIKLSRWIRCLFQMALTSKLDIAEHLLDQIQTVAENIKKTYPLEELEWLATTAFNLSVDFYCTSQDADCMRWAEKALSLADMANDGGALHELLQTKYVELRWEK